MLFYTVAEILCRFYVAFLSLPYILFFLNLFLSLLDCYTAVTYPFWHRRRVTVKFAIGILVSLNLSVALAVNWVYVGQVAPITCSYHVGHVVTLIGTIIFLYIPCVVFQIILYVKIKKIFRQNSLPMQQASSFNNTNSNNMTIHRSGATLSRREMEARRAFIAGVTPLLLLPCPLFLFALSFLVCFPFYGEDCESFTWLAPYLKELISLHVLVHAIVYRCTTNEFTSTAQPHRYSISPITELQPITALNCMVKLTGI